MATDKNHTCVKLSPNNNLLHHLRDFREHVVLRRKCTWRKMNDCINRKKKEKFIVYAKKWVSKAMSGMTWTMKECYKSIAGNKKQWRKWQANKQKEIWFWKMKEWRNIGQISLKEGRRKLCLSRSKFVALSSLSGEFGPDPPLCPDHHVESQFNLFFTQC